MEPSRHCRLHRPVNHFHRRMDMVRRPPPLDEMAGHRRAGDCHNASHSRWTDRPLVPTAVGFLRTCRRSADILLHRGRHRMFTGRRWVEEVPQIEFDHRRPSLFTLTLLSIFVLYVQLILGAMFRHHGMSWWPHVANAAIVAFVLTWTAIRALSQFSRIEAVRRPAIILVSLMIAQLCLGFIAFLTRVAWGRDAVQPELPMVISTVAHVAVGALLLATAVILAIQVWRQVPVSFEETVPTRTRKTVAA